MRNPLLVGFLSFGLVCGCAQHGVVVQKSFRGIPDAGPVEPNGAHSFLLRGPQGREVTSASFKTVIDLAAADRPVAEDGIYSFLLRDEQGTVHSQMVTASVYGRYQIGDYFDDLQPGPSAQHTESKEMVPPVDFRRGARHRTAGARRHHRRHTSVAKHHTHHSAKARLAQR